MGRRRRSGSSPSVAWRHLLDGAALFHAAELAEEETLGGGNPPMKKHYLLVSDFDQTLSFNDSGIVLSELLGISGFQEKVAGLFRLNLVQQGAELAYLLRHDPEFRRVRKEDL